MHTSTRLRAEDFYFWRHVSSGEEPVDFATFAPRYHELDRVGVVSPALEDGVLQTSYALLAFTTAFYDRLRGRNVDFFDYPQHFAFVGAEVSPTTESGGELLHVGDSLLPVSTPQVWNAWSWLDVWPNAKWVTAPSSATGLLQRTFDYQINRLFWPRSLQPGAAERPLPDHLWKMFKSSLKAVYLYGEAADGDVSRKNGTSIWTGLASERFELTTLAAVQEIVQESIVQLPASLLLPGVPHAVHVAQAATAPQVVERVSAADFLTAWQRSRALSLTDSLTDSITDSLPSSLPHPLVNPPVSR